MKNEKNEEQKTKKFTYRKEVHYHTYPVIEGEETVIKYVGFSPHGDTIYSENCVVSVRAGTDERARFVFECDKLCLNFIAELIARRNNREIDEIKEELKKIKMMEMDIGKEKYIKNKVFSH